MPVARERVATLDDVPILVRVINAAYLVEQFFIRGDRTTREEVEGLIDSPEGDFLVLESPGGEIAGCVYAKVVGGRGYLGFLSVDPAFQGQGLGKQLVAVVAAYCQAGGCEDLDLDVFNVRTELIPFYASLGFVAQSEAAYEHQETLLQPAHLIRMTKPLQP
jgi:ribosomal protein S18 acetylase RimI-like enzyme